MIAPLFVALACAHAAPVPASQAAPATASQAAPANAEPSTAATARTAADALSLGSKAPLPEISNYIRGARPEFFEPGKVYVIEFWATWCPPCRASMPHLSELAERHKDKGLVVIGVSDEEPGKVEAFLNKDEWKQKARYTLATDPDKSTHTAYMKASGQQGIPTAFVVKDGTVQWIGHPTELDKPLEQILAGSWDLKSAKRDFDAAMEAERKAMAKQVTIAKAYDAKDWATVLTAMDELIADAAGPDKAMLQLNKAQVLLIADRSSEGYALIDSVLKDQKDGQLQMMAASIVLRTPELRERRVDLAIGWLEAALKAEDGLSAQALAELAHAWSMKGDPSKAVDFTQRAIEAAQSWGPAADDYVAELKERLREYKAAIDQRTPAPPAK